MSSHILTLPLPKKVSALIRASFVGIYCRLMQWKSSFWSTPRARLNTRIATGSSGWTGTEFLDHSCDIAGSSGEEKNETKKPDATTWLWPHGTLSPYVLTLLDASVKTTALKEDALALVTNFNKVRDFNNAMGVKHSLDFDNVDLRLTLISEEWDEVLAEMVNVGENGLIFERKSIDKAKLAKELADLLYVVYGAADAFDIPIDEVFDAVHRSNMSKLGEDGKPIRREDGKVLKGPNYKAPDLSWVA